MSGAWAFAGKSREHRMIAVKASARGKRPTEQNEDNMEETRDYVLMSNVSNE
jgi:hypothetical protein